MFPFYFTSFFAICILGFWGWHRVLNHRPCRMIFVCCGICLVLFVAFCIRDAHDVKLRYEEISELRNDPTYYDDPQTWGTSSYFDNFSIREQELLNAYEWNSESTDWKDPGNLQNAVDIFHNVIFSSVTPEIRLETLDDPNFVALQKEAASHFGQLYDVSGWYRQIKPCEDSEVVSMFLGDTTEFDLMWLECSFEENTPTDYILLESSLKNREERYAEGPGWFGNFAVFIGLTDDGLPVFMSS